MLENCLSSVNNTTEISDAEIIVVDDGSDKEAADQNQSICKKYNAVYIKNEKNRGMAVARNRGIEEARGEWLVFIDDDVTVDQSWFYKVKEITENLPSDAVGFEGRINASGNGVWDREVINIKGGAFLTSHLALRRSVLNKCGVFDPNFEFKGPYCEDHELACRALEWGDIPFMDSVSVTHAPRKIKLINYLLAAPKRCRGLLFAEHYFYRKHPDRYHCFRAHRTFWGTYCSILFRNIINEIRRRRLITLLRHPLQSAVLILGALIEQITAWTLLPRFIFSHSLPLSTLMSFVDIRRTSSLWHIPEDRVGKLRINRNVVPRILFPLLKTPVYNLLPLLGRLNKYTQNRQCKIYLRIDDVFLDDETCVGRFCRLMEKYKYPFLAAVTGNDLLNTEYRTSVELIRNAGGTIGIHGFGHCGKFGPFTSEILQMHYPEIIVKVNDIKKYGIFNNGQPLILVPPFNAIGPDQIVFLSKIFSVICGGPETLRFTDRLIGPIALQGGGWYFPSIYPFYGSARKMLKTDLLRKLRKISGHVCITLHFTYEARDSFRFFERFLNELPINPEPWNRLF